MLVSFNYAATQSLRNQIERGMIRQENQPVMEAWSKFWYKWVSATFLHSYLETASKDSFLPEKKAELQLLLDFYLLEKVINALGNELNYRPEWVDIPLQLILQLIHSDVHADYVVEKDSQEKIIKPQ
jgi:maltose alpha-D-glucosyltransferase/alpha-amylase